MGRDVRSAGVVSIQGARGIGGCTLMLRREEHEGVECQGDCILSDAMSGKAQPDLTPSSSHPHHPPSLIAAELRHECRPSGGVLIIHELQLKDTKMVRGRMRHAFNWAGTMLKRMADGNE